MVMAKRRRQLPKLGSASIDTLDSTDAPWSAMDTSREVKLKEALLGATRGRPGLDALKEEAPRILAFRADDKQSQVRLFTSHVLVPDSYSFPFNRPPEVAFPTFVNKFMPYTSPSLSGSVNADVS